MGTGERNTGDNVKIHKHPIKGGVTILSVAPCYRNRDKLRPDGPQLARMQTLPYIIKLTKKASVLPCFVMLKQDALNSSVF